VRAVIQRVKEASVEVDGNVVGRIGRGFFILLGIHRSDTASNIPWMIDKIINLRIFEKEDRKFDESILDINGELLIVSQFTLYGDCYKGRRPSFGEAMEATRASVLFELFIEKAKEKVSQVETGIFQTSMNISLVNEGPVTVILDSKKETLYQS
jgi:D-tyrosyl-tRNA(Tyr) deacylase